MKPLKLKVLSRKRPELHRITLPTSNDTDSDSDSSDEEDLKM